MRPRDENLSMVSKDIFVDLLITLNVLRWCRAMFDVHCFTDQRRALGIEQLMLIGGIDPVLEHTVYFISIITHEAEHRARRADQPCTNHDATV